MASETLPLLSRATHVPGVRIGCTPGCRDQGNIEGICVHRHTLSRGQRATDIEATSSVSKVLSRRFSEIVTYTVMTVFAYTVQKSHISSVKKLAEKNWRRTLGCYDCDAAKNEVFGHGDSLELCARSLPALECMQQRNDSHR